MDAMPEPERQIIDADLMCHSLFLSTAEMISQTHDLQIMRMAHC